jgi:hypothetical protein
MSAFTKTVLALGLVAGLAIAANAQGGGEMRPLGINMGYAIDTKGNVKIIDLPAPMVKKMMSKATTVKRNVVIFMQDGRLMMSDWPTGQRLF